MVLDTRSGTVRGQADVAFHECPSGDVVLSLPVGAFGHDPEDAAFDAHSRHSYDLEPLGDGSWLTTDPEGLASPLDRPKAERVTPHPPYP
ncbi:hypothetical protein ACFQY7_47080 [Actinomadura luteofluorescens]|uniref:hypothetical protein n=1 Tax=Actinomadura luteofluorescens TaxID=46163 RepID=UPI00364019A4